MPQSTPDGASGTLLSIPSFVQITELDDGYGGYLLVTSDGMYVGHYEASLIIERLMRGYRRVSGEQIERWNELESDLQVSGAEPIVPPEKIKTRLGSVYLLKSGGRYKIGVSIDVEERRTQIASQSAYPVEIVHSVEVDDPFRIEKELHRRFARYRVRGEWFELDEGNLTAVLFYMDEWKSDGGEA